MYIDLMNKILFNRIFDYNFTELIDEYKDKNKEHIIKYENYECLNFYYKKELNNKFSSSDLIFACPDIFSNSILFCHYDIVNEKQNRSLDNLFMVFYNHKSGETIGSLWISLQLINNNTLGEEIRNELSKIINNIDKNINQKDLKFFTFIEENGKISIFINKFLFKELHKIFNVYSFYQNKRLIRKDELYCFFQLLYENKYFDYLADINLLDEYEKEKKHTPNNKAKAWRSDVGKIILDKNEELKRIINMVGGENRVSWKLEDNKGELLSDFSLNLPASLDDILDNDFWNSELKKLLVDKITFVFKISNENNDKIGPNKILTLYILCLRSKKQIEILKTDWNNIKNILIDCKENHKELKFRKNNESTVYLTEHTGKNDKTYLEENKGNYNTKIKQWTVNKKELINGQAFVVDICK